MEKTRVCVIGAAGRMGRRLVALIMESEDLVLSGAIEVAGNPVIGTDAGILAGSGCANFSFLDGHAEPVSTPQELAATYLAEYKYLGAYYTLVYLDAYRNEISGYWL